MEDKITLKNKELVLRVSQNVDPKIWDEVKYYDFIDKLCSHRQYQKDAIFTALRYLLSDNYENIFELAKENFNENEHLRDKFITLENYRNELNFPDKLCASIDLATGTGKSYVLYALAVIMLAEKKVDQVLVLVPSITIEQGLIEKFKQLSSDTTLANLLCRNGMNPPLIINGSDSIIKGSICIENRDAIYKNARTSITDSLQGKGGRTLLLNDEVHHVYNTENNEWKKFIDDSRNNDIKFRYLIGVSGTCYSGSNQNSYFPDVIYRYSLKDAMEEGYIKHIEYIDEYKEPTVKESKWAVIMNSHNEIKERIKNSGILPISIVVTANTNTCDKIAKEFKQFLMEQEKLSNRQVDEKVLVIHSKNSAARDRIRLKDVDDPNSKVEWIFSVSMLTEGWDVKRVFQIIPHEKRAFNSKLLIAQVLGRGVRVPNGWIDREYGVAKVTVFNHEKWSSNIRNLVNEILELEKRITSHVVADSQYNFDIVNIKYGYNENVVETKKEDTYELFESGYVNLPTKAKDEEIETSFIDTITDIRRTWSTIITNRTYSTEEMAATMYKRFEDLDDDKKTLEYQNKWTIDMLEDIIIESLNRSSNSVITEDLKKKFLQALGPIFREGNKSVSYEAVPDMYKCVDTRKLKVTTISASSLRKECTIIITSDTEKYISKEQKEIYNVIIAPSSGYNFEKVDNIYTFRTPQNFVICDSDNEKKFIKKIIKCSYIQKWIKSSSMDFYAFKYTYRKADHHIRDEFNPDFFLFIGKRLIIVEIKGDEQISNPEIENMGKYRSAINHFTLINNYFESNENEMRYKFTFLTPKSYDAFFRVLEEACETSNYELIDNFNSDLDVVLEKDN